MMPPESQATGPSRSRSPLPVRQGELGQIDRRSWLAAAGTLLAGVATRRSGAVPPSDRIRVGAIGIGNRGRLLLEQLPADAELVAICDCNLPQAEAPSGSLVARYPSGVEVKFMLKTGPKGGAVFIGEHGKLEINRNKVTSNPPEIAAEILAHVDVAAEEIAWSDQTALWQAQQHLQNWLDCIRSRERPVADVEIGHRSISVCHLANIVRRLGRPLDWDPAAERFRADPDADGLLSRPRRAGFELPVG